MNVDSVIVVVGSAFLVLGSVIILSAGVGLIRLPDLYTRTSAVGTAAGLGIALIILGVLTLDFSVANLIKAAIAIVAQLLTSAMGSYVLARAGYLTQSTPTPSTSPDELRDSVERSPADR